MNGKTCLDSSVVIALFRGDPDVSESIERLHSPVLTSFALAEMIYGAKLSNKKDENLRMVDSFAARCLVLYPDADSLDAYTELKLCLRAQGTPIPENDIWIAALCLQHDLELAFRDKHFEFVPGLKKLHWRSTPHS